MNHRLRRSFHVDHPSTRELGETARNEEKCPKTTKSKQKKNKEARESNRGPSKRGNHEENATGGDKAKKKGGGGGRAKGKEDVDGAKGK